MSFVLKKQQKLGLKELNEAFNDQLIVALEWHMSAAYVKQPNEKTTPLLESRDKLKAVKKASQELGKKLSALTADDYSRVSEIVGIHINEKYLENSSSRRKHIDAIEVVAQIEYAALSFNKDSIDAYGSRANDKAIAWLIDFWDENIRKSIHPLSEDGEFARFTAIVLDRDPDAARKAISRFLKS
jgi:hypothetical protein